MFTWLIQSELTKINAFIFKNWIISRGNIFLLLEIVFWPMVGLLSLGMMTDFIGVEPQMKTFILTGIITMSAIQVCQLDISYVLLFDIWSKAIKLSFVAPIGMRHLLGGAFLLGGIRGTAVFFFQIGVGFVLLDFKFLFPGSILPVIVFLIGIFLCSAIIGVLVCILILNFGNRAEIAGLSAMSLMLLVCGIYYPVLALPDWAGVISEFLPLTYFLEYIREFHGIASTHPHVLVKAFALAFFYLLLEMILLQWSLERVRRNGMLLRLSE